MLGKIFCILIILSVLGALCTGNIGALAPAALTGASESVTVTLAMLGGIGFWSALMRVFEKGGVMARVGRFTAPLLKCVYPSAADVSTCASLTASFLANLFGLGSAAMPAGIEAVKALQRHAENPHTASDETILFTVLCTVPLQFFPTTLIALRVSDGDAAPYRLLPPIWCTQLACAVFAFVLCRLMARLFKEDAA